MPLLSGPEKKYSENENYFKIDTISRKNDYVRRSRVQICRTFKKGGKFELTTTGLKAMIEEESNGSGNYISGICHTQIKASTPHSKE